MLDAVEECDDGNGCDDGNDDPSDRCTFCVIRCETPTDCNDGDPCTVEVCSADPSRRPSPRASPGWLRSSTR